MSATNYKYKLIYLFIFDIDITLFLGEKRDEPDPCAKIHNPNKVLSLGRTKSP